MLRESPEVCEEVSERLLVIVQVCSRHKEALDNDPGLLPVVRVGAAGLEGVEGYIDGLLCGQTHRRLTVLEVHQDAWSTRLLLIVGQLQHTTRQQRVTTGLLSFHYNIIQGCF